MFSCGPSQIKVYLCYSFSQHPVLPFHITYYSVKLDIWIYLWAKHSLPTRISTPCWRRFLSFSLLCSQHLEPCLVNRDASVKMLSQWMHLANPFSLSVADSLVLQGGVGKKEHAELKTRERFWTWTLGKPEVLKKILGGLTLNHSWFPSRSGLAKFLSGRNPSTVRDELCLN